MNSRTSVPIHMKYQRIRELANSKDQATNVDLQSLSDASPGNNQDNRQPSFPQSIKNILKSQLQSPPLINEGIVSQFTLAHPILSSWRPREKQPLKSKELQLEANNVLTPKLAKPINETSCRSLFSPSSSVKLKHITSRNQSYMQALVPQDVMIEEAVEEKNYLSQRQHENFVKFNNRMKQKQQEQKTTLQAELRRLKA